MKKLFGLAIVCASVGLLSCTGSQKTNTETAENQPVMTVPDTHNAKNSVDYKGTYKGVLPCADCDSIVVSLTLGDTNYTKIDTYHKNNQTAVGEYNGTYTWNAEGNQITLDGIKDAPNKYFVGEGYITQLDMEGNEITGDLASMYILRE